MKHSLHFRIIARRAAIVSTTLAGIFGFYVLSIVLRASLAEQKLFGRSYLVPLTLSPKQFDQPPTTDSYGSGTYKFLRDGNLIRMVSIARFSGGTG